jgi:hypothetical protein
MNSLEIGEGAQLRPPAAFRRWGIYTLMVLATVAVFFLIRRYGETLTAPAAPAGGRSTPMPGSRNEALLHLLLALVTTVATSPVLRLLRPQTDG